MFNRLFITSVILSLASFSALALNDNPFAKNEKLNIGKDVSWSLDKAAGIATKSAGDDKGAFYHLRFDNKQIELLVSSDDKGASPKSFTQFEIKDFKIDGKQSPLFKWCLKNQQRHDRFLQQGLKVKKDICSVDGENGVFVMRLNKATLASMQSGKRLTILIKPFRTPLEINYDISDFNDMTVALSAKASPAYVTANKKCWAGPPAQYKSIKAVEYDCNDAIAKKDAEAWVTRLVNKEKAKVQQAESKKAAALATEKERQRKLAEQKKKELAAKQQQEEKARLEAEALAASQMNQAKINDEITQKMVSMCDKFWSKGEHRCYCQKYIDHAPASIQSNSSCK